jgi:uncharacterized membrane protein
MFWGMLFGMLFFVPFLGMAVGAGMGALMGKVTKSAVDKEYLDVGGDVGISTENVLWTLVAITPIVGSARVLSAVSRMDQAGLLTTDSDETPTEGG